MSTENLIPTNALQRFIDGIKPLYLVILLSLIGFGFRFYNLGLQSFWIDELHTLIEADPELTWSQMFDYLICCDQQTPIYFFIQRFWFGLFGQSEFIARFPSVVFGTLCIPAAYQLGKTVLNNRVGLIMALFTMVNYFGIEYSQEARVYSLFFLISILSCTYTFKLINKPNRQNTVKFTLVSIVLIYTHYFGLFLLFSQFILLLASLFYSQNNLKQHFILYAVSGVIIVLSYLPWVPFLLEMTNIEKFWIEPIPVDFLYDYFFIFFGNSALLKPLLIFLLILSFLTLANNKIKNGNEFLSNKKSTLVTIACICWILISISAPTIRSFSSVPMLQPRYLIMIVPALILLVSLGVNNIKSDAFRWFVIFAFAVLSLGELLLTKHFYSTTRKMQFRELTEEIIRLNPKNYKVVNEVTGWHQRYYFKHFKKEELLANGSEKDAVTALINDKENGFWIVNLARNENNNQAFRQGFVAEKGYQLSKELNFHDLTAFLFESSSNSVFSFDPKEIPDDKKFNQDGITFLPIWAGSEKLGSVLLESGEYNLSTSVRGTPCLGEFPILNFYLDTKLLGSVDLNSESNEFNFSFDIENEKEGVVSVKIMNDVADEATGEDRNAFIRSVNIKKS